MAEVKKEFDFSRSEYPRFMAELSSFVQTLDPVKQYVVTVQEKREKRSLNANAYMWKLCTDIAEVLSKDGKVYTKEDIYREHIKNIGVFRTVEIAEVAANTLCHSWTMLGTGWVYELVDYAEHKGFVMVRLYYGSSTYNTKQMSRLIDNLVQDCEALGIPTLEDIKIEEMCANWQGRV